MTRRAKDYNSSTAFHLNLVRFTICCNPPRYTTHQCLYLKLLFLFSWRNSFVIILAILFHLFSIIILEFWAHFIFNDCSTEAKTSNRQANYVFEDSWIESERYVPRLQIGELILFSQSSECRATCMCQNFWLAG